jgi:FtsZ-binding cell division protein ZapB
MLKTGRPVDTEALDRLEEKVKLLVALVGRMRTEQARLADDYQTASKELEAARARLQEAEGATAEIAALKDERDLIRARVGSLLEQIEGLSL